MLASATGSSNGFVKSSSLGERVIQRPNAPSIVRRLIKDGDVSGIEKMMQQGYEMNLRYDKCECVPVVTALMYASVPMVECLQKGGTRISGKSCQKEPFPDRFALDLLVLRHEANDCLKYALNHQNPSRLELCEMVHAAAASGNTAALEALLPPNVRQRDLLSPDRKTRTIHLGPQTQTPRLASVLHTAVSAQQYSAAKSWEKADCSATRPHVFTPALHTLRCQRFSPCKIFGCFLLQSVWGQCLFRRP